MELKVWVEGIQRIVCGVTENTTCQVCVQKCLLGIIEDILVRKSCYERLIYLNITMISGSRAFTSIACV
jgi:hypothetical protein